MATITSVYKNVRGLRSAIEDAGRVRQIASVLAGHGFGALVNRLQLVETFGLERILNRGDDDKVSFEKRLRIACEELGPTFIKLAQVLSTRSDIVGPALSAELEGLQDDVAPMKWEDVQFQIQKAMGTSVDETFAKFEREPLACASVAQVHHATLKSGESVVVKVQRRRIQKTIRSDLNILYFLANRAESLIPELKLLDPVGVIEEFDRAMTKELDFNNERRNIERFAHNFADFKGIEVPQIYPDYCGKCLLTMEFIDGVKVTEAVEKYGLEPYPLATTLLRGLFKMVFKDGAFHGDMHPGNLLVRKDGTLVLIDFGLVGRLLPRHRDAIVDLLLGIAKEDYEVVARTFFDLGIKVPGVQYDYTAFENDIVELAETHITARTLEQIDVQSFFADLVSGAVRHQIKMPPTYTMVFKALMTVEGIGKTLTPNLNFIEEVKPFATEILTERYKPERVLKDVFETLTQTSKFARQLSASAPRLLQELELGHLQIRVESERFGEIRLEIQRIGTRLIRAIVFAASAIVGTMAWELSGQQVWGLHVISFGAFVVTAIAGLPLIFSLFSRD